jgi:chromosome segregation ATPase
VNGDVPVNRYLRFLCPTCRHNHHIQQAIQEVAQHEAQIEAERRRWHAEREAEQRCTEQEKVHLGKQIERFRQEADLLRQERDRLAGRCAEADAAREDLARQAQALRRELEEHRRKEVGHQAEVERWRTRAQKLKRALAEAGDGAGAREELAREQRVLADLAQSRQAGLAQAPPCRAEEDGHAAQLLGGPERARLEAEAARWRGEADSLRAEVDRLGRAVADSRRMEEAARRRQDELATEVQGLWTEVLRREGPLGELRKELEEARAQVARNAAERQAETEVDSRRAEQEQVALRKEIDRLRLEADAMRRERDELAAGRAAIDTDRKDLVRQAQRLQAEVEQLQGRQAEGQRRFDQERTTLQGEIGRLRGEAVAAGKEHGLLVSRYQEVQDSGRALARRHEELGGQLRALRTELEQQRQRTAGLQKDLDAAARQAAKERRQWQEERAEAQRRAEQERARLRGDIDRLRGDVDRLQGEAGALKQERDLLGAQCARSETIRESTQKRLLDMVGTLTRALDERGVPVPVQLPPPVELPTAEPEVAKLPPVRGRMFMVILVLFMVAFSLMWFLWSI